MSDDGDPYRILPLTDFLQKGHFLASGVYRTNSCNDHRGYPFHMVQANKGHQSQMIMRAHTRSKSVVHANLGIKHYSVFINRENISIRPSERVLHISSLGMLEKEGSDA